MTFAESDGSSEKSNDDNDDGTNINSEPLNIVTQKFLCKVRGENRLTGKAVQNIGIATNHLMQEFLRQVQQNVGEVLHGVDLGNENSKKIENIFDEAVQEIEVLRTPMSETISSADSYNYVGEIVSLIMPCFLKIMCYFVSFHFIIYLPHSLYNQ